MYKSCALLANRKSKINNTQGDDVRDLDVVIPIYTLLEYNDNYWKTFETLQQCYWDQPDANAGNTHEFNANNATTDSFQLKQKLTEETDKNDTKDVEMIVLFKHLSNFWRTLEMLLLSCENNTILTWFSNRVTKSSDLGQAKTFAITNTKTYVLKVTLSTADNTRQYKTASTIKIRF